jgi:predicted PurR-regulated permease PerM
VKPGRPDATPPRRNYPSDFQRRTLWLAITGVSMLALGAVAVFSIWVVAYVLQFLQPVLVPIAFAGILAYLLEPLVQKLTTRGTPRFRAMMWVWVGFHGVMLLLLISVAVPTISSVRYFVVEKQGAIAENVGSFLSNVVDGVDTFVSKFRGKDDEPAEEQTPVPVTNPGAHTVRDGESIRSIAALYSVTPEDLEYANRGRKVEKGVILDLPEDAKPAKPHGDGKTAGQSWLRARISAWVAANGEEITARVTGGLNRSVQGIFGLFGYLVGFILVPLYLYYFLKESAAIQKGWSNYIPLRASKFKAELVDCLNEINGYLIAFFRGQMLVSMIDGLLVGISLALIGLPYAFLIGVFVALLGLIPYVGNILCWFAAVAVSIAHFAKTDASGALEHSLWGIQEVWAYPLIVSAIFVVVQQLNSLVTAPRIVGDAVGLHPLTVIFSVLFWSLLIGGLLGALLAVPLTASLKVIFRRYIWERRVQPQLAGPQDYPVS